MSDHKSDDLKIPRLILKIQSQMVLPDDITLSIAMVSCDSRLDNQKKNSEILKHKSLIIDSLGVPSRKNADYIINLCSNCVNFYIPDVKITYSD